MCYHIRDHLDFLLCYFLGFYHLQFTFRPVIHLEFIFMRGVRSASGFIFFAHKYPVVPLPFVEITFFNFPKPFLVLEFLFPRFR